VRHESLSWSPAAPSADETSCCRCRRARVCRSGARRRNRLGKGRRSAQDIWQLGPGDSHFDPHRAGRVQRFGVADGADGKEENRAWMLRPATVQLQTGLHAQESFRVNLDGDELHPIIARRLANIRARSDFRRTSPMPAFGESSAATRIMCGVVGKAVGSGRDTTR